MFSFFMEIGLWDCKKEQFLSADAILLFTKPSSSTTTQYRDKAWDEIVSGILGQFKGNELEIGGEKRDGTNVT